jgi:polar amino acid transport system ATP-binding protein
MGLIEVRKLDKHYDGKSVLSGIDLAIHGGDTKVIMGPSGCGKTTLIMCMMRLVEPSAGAVYFHGADMTRPEADIRAFRQKIGFVFQHFALYRHLTALDNITLGLRKLKRMTWKAAREKAMHELARFDMASHADSHPMRLSGGQKQRVALARALSMDPELLIFDEPTSALDPVMTREVASIINRLQDEKVTMICVTHDVALADRVSEQLVFLDQGKVKAEGSMLHLSRDHDDPAIRDFFSRHRHA